MAELILKVDNVSKEYRLGQIGGTTLKEELQRKKARLLKREDPTKKIGAKDVASGESFMALDGVSFEVKKGERVGIIGHNGAGKSTLLKLLSRITAPSEGEIGLNGRVASMLEVGTGFHQELTGRENIYMNGAILGMTKKEIESKIEDIIDFSECRQFIDTPVKRYSSGMYVKLAFAVAAHLDSEILIMDEVLAVGDMAFQKKCLDKMNSISREDGRTILYVSHNMSTIRQLCNRVICLEKGRIVYDGDVETGIDIYLGRGNYEKDFCFMLKDVQRPSGFHGTKIRLNKLEFTDRKTVFERTEQVGFSISFDSFDDIRELKMRFTLCSRSGSIIGTAQTYKALCDTEAGKSYEVSVSFDINNIVPGAYYFYVDVYAEVKSIYKSYDHPLKAISFEVADSHPEGIKWDDTYFGYVKLNEIKLTDVNELGGVICHEKNDKN